MEQEWTPEQVEKFRQIEAGLERNREAVRKWKSKNGDHNSLYRKQYAKSEKNLRYREQYRASEGNQIAQAKYRASERGKERQRVYGKTNREKISQRAKAFLKANPDKRREYWKKSKYRISAERFAALKAEQNDACYICLRVPDTELCVDHDHRTGKIRKLLCYKCNAAIGLFAEDSAALRRAADYLEQADKENSDQLA